MLGELELVIGIVVNGIGDVDEFGGGVVNKIEYVEWCNYMIKLIVCVIFFLRGGGGEYVIFLFLYRYYDFIILSEYIDVGVIYI